MSPEVVEHVSTPEGTETEKKKKKLPQFKKKYLTSTLCFGLVAVGGLKGYNLFFLEEPAIALTGTVSYGVLGTSIEGSGSTSSVLTQSVSVASTSEVLGVYVTPGDEILEGQLLYIQDDSELDDRIEAFNEVIEGHNDTIKTYNDNISTYEGNISDYYDTIEDYNDIIQDYYEDIADYKVDIQDYYQDIEDYYEDIKDLEEDILDLTIKAPFSGKITEVSMISGDAVTSSTKVAQLTSSVDLEVSLYFSYAYEDDIYLGQSAMVSIPEQMLTIQGEVTDITKVEYITKEGTKCFEVTISLPNPGSLNAGTEVSATIGTIYPVEAGILSNWAETALTPPITGTIEEVFVKNYLNVVEGQALFSMDHSSIEDEIEAVHTLIEGVHDSIADTQERILDTEELIVSQRERIVDVNESIADVQDKITDVRDNVNTVYGKIADVYEDIKDVEEERSDFEVYSEISGKVITVNVREGFSPNAAQAAVVIYNMDTMELTANVDELDMEHVTMGMDVNLSYSTGGSNQNFTGYVSAMSYEATNDNGVAYFPIVIAVESEGAISSGVNVSYAISVGDTEEGYLVPVDALKQSPQGTCVYIQGTAPTGTTSVTVEEGAMPEGYYAQLVEIATSNSSYALIREGLTEGMTVFTRYQATAPTNGSTTSANASGTTDMDAMMAMRESMMASGMNSGTGTTTRPTTGTTGGRGG